MNPHGGGGWGGQQGPPGGYHGGPPQQGGPWGQGPPPQGYGHPGGHYGGQPPPKKGTSGATIIIWIIGAIAAVTLGSCAFCAAYTRSAAKSAAGDFVEDMEKQAEERREKKAAAKKIDVAKLIDAFKDDGKAAMKKYGDDYVRATGIVSEIDVATPGKRYVYLSPTRERSDPAVACRVVLQSEADGLSVGDEITVLGRVEEYEHDIDLQDCDIK